MGVSKKPARDSLLMQEIKQLYLSRCFNQLERISQLKACIDKAASLGSAQGLACTLLFKASLAQIKQACEDMSSTDSPSARPQPILIQASLPAAPLY
jgi:hypothetical protein